MDSDERNRLTLVADFEPAGDQHEAIAVEDRLVGIERFGRRIVGDRQQEAEASIAADSIVQSLQERFGASVQDGSVKPID